MNSEENRTYPPQNILLNTDENARFVMGPIFRGPDGTLVDMTYDIDPYGTGTYRIQMIGAQVDDAKLERIFAILQYTTFHSEEIWYRYKYGIEGIHYKWSGEPYVSAMIATPTAELPPEYQGGSLNVFGLWCYPSTVQNQIDNAVKYGFWAYMPFMHAYGLFEKYAMNRRNSLPPPTWDTICMQNIRSSMRKLNPKSMRSSKISKLERSMEKSPITTPNGLNTSTNCMQRDCKS